MKFWISSFLFRSIKFTDTENELNKDSTEQPSNDESSESTTIDSVEVTTAAEGKDYANQINK